MARFKKIRKIRNRVPDKCMDCKNKYLCIGDCKAHTVLKFKYLNKKDPLCSGKTLTTYSQCIYSLIRLFDKHKTLKKQMGDQPV